MKKTQMKAGVSAAHEVSVRVERRVNDHLPVVRGSWAGEDMKAKKSQLLQAMLKPISPSIAPCHEQLELVPSDKDDDFSDYDRLELEPEEPVEVNEIIEASEVSEPAVAAPEQQPEPLVEMEVLLQ